MGVLDRAIRRAVLKRAAGKAAKKAAVGGIDWDSMTLEEARAAALRGDHLSRTSAGRLVGAPASVNTGAELGAMRRGIDDAVAKGSFNAGWYQDAAGATEAMSGGSATRAHELAVGQGIMSPRRTPADALNLTLRQRNARVLRGPDEPLVGITKSQREKYDAVLRGEDVELGPKVDAYDQKFNPARAQEARVRGVNDSWMMRLFGYEKLGDTVAGAGTAQHSFMTGENLRAADRAAKKGLLPPGVEPGVDTVQAASWATPRLAALRAKSPGRSEAELRRRAEGRVSDAMKKHTYNETTEVAPSLASEHLKGFVDLPLEQKQAASEKLLGRRAGDPDPYWEALDMPQRPTADGIGQFTEEVPAPPARVTRPLRSRDGDVIPGLGTPEREAYEASYLRNVEAARGTKGRTFEPTELPIDSFIGGHSVPDASNPSRTRLYERGYREGTPPQRVLAYEDPPGSGRYSLLDGNRRLGAARAAGLRSIPALVERDGVQAAAKPAAPTVKRTYSNPNRTAKPMVSYAPGGEAALGAPEAEAVKAVSTLRSATDVQAAGAGHAVKQSWSPASQNAATVSFPRQLTAEETSQLYARAEAAGLNLVDTGGGTFTFVGDFGGMKAARFRKAFAPLEAQLQGAGADILKGEWVGTYNELPAFGEGRVTRKVLEDVKPPIATRLDQSMALRSDWLRRNAVEKEVAQEHGLGKPRADVQKLRSILSKGGVKGLREYVLKHGYKGLPALTLAAGDEDR